MSENVHELVDTAVASIADAACKAEMDMSRPLYHFRGPAQWMDDPNGIIFHNGVYHMMYSLNPHTAAHRAGMVYKTAVRVWDPNSPDWTGGITVWGHARSRDLVHWEHLPIAIYPDVDKGEHFVWFGCTTINDEGVPMAIYTAVGPQMRPEDTAQQWAAVGDPDLIRWKPVPSNPIVPASVHGEDRIGEWRDPFVFKEGGRTFMVTGARSKEADGGRAVVTLYEALNGSYTEWVYRGILFRHPRREVPSAECPNLFKLDGKWVLLVSPHAEVEYYVGELDLDNYTFTIENSGIVDRSRNYYATNVLFDVEGRAVLWGAIVGFKGTTDWNGCLSLPRQIHVCADGILLQEPVAELTRLRGHGVSFSDAIPAAGNTAIGRIENGEALELESETAAGSPDHTIRLGYAQGHLDIEVTGTEVRLGAVTLPRTAGNERTRVRLFVDRTVAEVFVDESEVATCIVPLVSGAVDISIVATGALGPTTCRAWQLDAKDLFSFAAE